jgi:hypothetical protein
MKVAVVACLSAKRYVHINAGHGAKVKKEKVCRMGLNRKSLHEGGISAGSLRRPVTTKPMIPLKPQPSEKVLNGCKQ